MVNIPITRYIIFVNCLMIAVSCSTNKTLKPFTSDGCSMFPDRSLINEDDWCECCFEHDVAYWQGGTKEDRDAADERFKNCILKKTGDEFLAELMFIGVRLGGSPFLPAWYRWGYGWNYLRGYRALNAEEQKIVQEKLNSGAQSIETCETE